MFTEDKRCRFQTSRHAMAPVYGWGRTAAAAASNTVIISAQGDRLSEDINNRLKKNFLATLCKRPSVGLTEVFSLLHIVRICRLFFPHSQGSARWKR